MAIFEIQSLFLFADYIVRMKDDNNKILFSFSLSLGCGNKSENLNPFQMQVIEIAWGGWYKSQLIPAMRHI